MRAKKVDTSIRMHIEARRVLMLMLAIAISMLKAQLVTCDTTHETHHPSQQFHLPYLDNLVYQAKYHDTFAGGENGLNASSGSERQSSHHKLFQFGEKIPVSISMHTHGHWITLPNDEGKLWQLRINSPSAYSLNFLCDQFKLPPGSTLYAIGDNDQMDVYTPDTHNKPHGHLATMPMDGRYLELEYYQPKDTEEEAQFHICFVIHGFRPPGEFLAPYAASQMHDDSSVSLNKSNLVAPAPARARTCHLKRSSTEHLKSADASLHVSDSLSAGDCHINAPHCEEAHAWSNQAQATVLIMTNDATGYCTGCMVNNARQDGRQLMLTAKHCIIDDRSLNYRYNIVVFNYQASKCTPDASERDGSTWKMRRDGKRGGINRLLRQTVQGMKLLATSPSTDAALVELDETIPESYNVYLAGWSTASTPPVSTACLHHPSGDLKKISVKNQPLVPFCIGRHCAAISTGQSVMINGDTGWLLPLDQAKRSNYWYVNQWSHGVTEPGSSGCPLFDDEGYLIGHLRGGLSNCDKPSGHDIFGTVAAAMVNGLHKYLCPDHTHLPTRLKGVYLNDVRSRQTKAAVHSSSMNTRSSPDSYKQKDAERRMRRYAAYYYDDDYY